MKVHDFHEEKPRHMASLVVLSTKSRSFKHCIFGRYDEDRDCVIEEWSEVEYPHFTAVSASKETYWMYLEEVGNAMFDETLR